MVTGIGIQKKREWKSSRRSIRVFYSGFFFFSNIVLRSFSFYYFLHSNNSYFNNFWVGFVSRFDFLVWFYSISFMFDQCLIFLILSGVLQ